MRGGMVGVTARGAPRERNMHDTTEHGPDRRPETDPPFISRRADDAARRLALAGLGAVDLARETAEETFDRLVERGQRTQGDIEGRLRDARMSRRARRSRLGDACRNAMDAFLDTINVPNKADVDTINVKLNILSRKLDDLQGVRAQAGQPAAAPPDPDVT
jgi:polyhydroxyalkanoate synthesis regulator phasin